MVFYENIRQAQHSLLDKTSKCVNNIHEASKSDQYHDLIDDYSYLVFRGVIDVEVAANRICNEIN